MIADNYAWDDGGGLAYCDGTIQNCTIVSNGVWDDRDAGGGLAYCDGVIENCIVWSNTSRGGEIYGSSTPRYSCWAGGSGEGNIRDNPLFSDGGWWVPDPNDLSNEIWFRDYHLKSEAGRWDPVAGAWVYDDVTSPCIDGGDPGSDWFGEYWPHGGRINMGAYGGTRYASMSLSEFGNVADLDNDFGVGFLDFGAFSGEWNGQSNAQGALNPPHFRAGANGPPWRGDLDRDGVVGFGDLVLFAEEWLFD